MDQMDVFSLLPVGCYLQYTAYQFNNELFRNLLPQRSYGGKILSPIIHEIFDNELFDNNETCLLEMFHQLLQRLHFDEPLVVNVMVDDDTGYLDINNITVAGICDIRSLYSAYIGCLILVELQFDMASVPDDMAGDIQHIDTVEEFTYAHALDDMLRNYRQQSLVKSLLRLCILQTRNSMRSLDDDSFLSLPVPPYIRKLLTYHDVAEKIFFECIKDKLCLY